jgi:hypothetical protein
MPEHCKIEERSHPQNKDVELQLPGKMHGFARKLKEDSPK